MKFQYGDKVEYTGNKCPNLKGETGVVWATGMTVNLDGSVTEHVEVSFDYLTTMFFQGSELNDLTLLTTIRSNNYTFNPHGGYTIPPAGKYEMKYHMTFANDLKDTHINAQMPEKHIHKVKRYVGLTGLNSYDYCEECGEKV